MRVDGEELNNEDAVYGPFVIRRGDKLHGFYTRPVWTMDGFDEMVPEPEPLPGETVFTKNGKKPDFDHPEFKARLAKYSRQRWGYFVLYSLEPSNVEFDGVDIGDPESLDKVEEAIKASLGHYEYAGLMRLVDEANSIDKLKMEANRKSFLSQSRESEGPSLTKNTDVQAST